MDRPLSFCMITTFYPPYHFGGEAMYLYHFSNALARRGHRVTVVHCVDAYRMGATRGPRGSFPHHENVRVESLESPLGFVSPLVTYLSGRPGLKAPALDRLFGQKSFDVVHFHLVTLFGPGVIRYGEGALRLYTTHDHWLVCPMYDLWKLNREVCEEAACIRCTLANRRPPQLWRYTKILDRELPKIDAFISPSRSTIEQHRRRGFRYPMRHLPLFLPATGEGAPEEAARHRGSRPYFLFVGRLVKIKGAQTLINAFRRYHDADLLIAGDGNYQAELERQAAGMDHVRFLGRVRPDELRELYRGAIALLVPSLVYETFGFITLEAYGQRTPVIARDLGAVAEIVHDTGGGLTFSTEDELLDAMRRLQLDGVTRDTLGAAGHEAVQRGYSEEAHVAAYFDIIREAGSKGVRTVGRPA
jgi:glycosyltransferase involved in cell wall biosynthesis